MKIQEISKNELMQIKGGGIKEAAVTTFWYVYKYSSLTGALLTGIVEGYYEEKANQQ